MLRSHSIKSCLSPLIKRQESVSLFPKLQSSCVGLTFPKRLFTNQLSIPAPPLLSPPRTLLFNCASFPPVIHRNHVLLTRFSSKTSSHPSLNVRSGVSSKNITSKLEKFDPKSYGPEWLKKDILLFESQRSSRYFFLLTVVAWACIGGCVINLLNLFDLYHYSDEEVDKTEIVFNVPQNAFAVAVGELLAIALFFGVRVYRKQYIKRLLLLKGGERVQLTTFSALGHEERAYFPVTTLRANIDLPPAEKPNRWTRFYMRITDKRKFYIVDATAENYTNYRLLRRVLTGEPLQSLTEKMLNWHPNQPGKRYSN